MYSTGIYLFTQDLRTEDNPLLLRAAAECQSLVCIFIQDDRHTRPTNFGFKPLGTHRQQFMAETLHDLHHQLEQRGQQLLILEGPAHHSVCRIAQQFDAQALYCMTPLATYEQQQLEHIQMHSPWLKLHTSSTDTLLDPAQLPFSLNKLPATFTQFRKKVEQLDIPPPERAPARLPPSPGTLPAGESPQLMTRPSHKFFSGGSSAARAHLQHYFASEHPAHYKETRNTLECSDASSRFSPWLANGSLSARSLLQAIRQYEISKVANESTYWLFFELLWREYFHHYARAHGHRLFVRNGITGAHLLTSYYPSRLKQWCQGTTEWPLVNACMHQLNETGFMSNRGRQLVASCLIHELDLDWRYGAAYFEQQLIDYDVASNWGNWQYLAGVGADPRGSRRFNQQKQADIYDPQQAFIRQWQGVQTAAPLHHTDMVDWPIMPDK